MFAMVNYDVTTPEDFDFLGSLFSAFDEAVEQSGMFKYQHVSSGACHYFIVACPCVSNPYKDAGSESYSEYPYAKNYLDMIALGFDLIGITSKVLSSSSVDEFDKLREVPKRTYDEMQIKVGISSGPAAGVVLGRCRRFYCVYGDTINTAARMSASSCPGAVRVTAEIGGHPSVAQGSWLMSEWLGKVWVKGKGDMEVCDVSLKSESFFERTMPARKAVIARRRVSKSNLSVNFDDSDDVATPDSSSISSGFGSHAGVQPLPNNEILESWINSAQSSARPWINSAQSSARPVLMTLKRFRPQFSSPKHEQAFQNSKTQNRKKMEQLHGGFIFQLGLTFWLCHKTFTSGVSCKCVGESRLECGKSEPLGRDLINIVVWMMVAFVAISYCLVLYVAGTLGSWFISLQNVAIRYNLMADGSKWLLDDKVSEASDLTEESDKKVSQRKVRFCEVMLGLCKFVCCYSSLIVGPLLPSQRDALIGMGIGHQQTFGLYGVSFEVSCGILLGYIPALAFRFLLESPSKTFMTFLGFSEEMPAHVVEDPTFWFRNFLAVVLSITAAAAGWRSERMAWRTEMCSRDQLNQRRTVLLDLLPSEYLRQLIKGCEYIKCSSGRAVVLQLDLCNFTVLSEQLVPEKLADVVNSLIRDFDECVLGSVGHMIKIDTIGDAYIVVNWMTSGNPSSFSDSRSDDHQQQICTMCLYLDVVIVANNILSVLAKHRAKTGIDLHARIGIGAGEVISGVMGRLQPRFCVYGPAMIEAAENERQGLADKVHCTQEFFDVVTNGMCATPCSAHLQHKIDGIRLVHRMVQEGKLTWGKPTESG
jgi:class 3 adenylate cyclase